MQEYFERASSIRIWKAEKAWDEKKKAARGEGVRLRGEGERTGKYLFFFPPSSAVVLWSFDSRMVAKYAIAHDTTAGWGNPSEKLLGGGAPYSVRDHGMLFLQPCVRLSSCSISSDHFIKR